MCLNTVETTNPKRKSGLGWKLAIREGDQLSNYFSFVCFAKFSSTNTDNASGILYGETDDKRYESGYHVFKTLNKWLKDIYQYDRAYPVVLLRVRYRGAVAEGKQNFDKVSYPVVVARSFDIIKEYSAEEVRKRYPIH